MKDCLFCKIVKGDIPSHKVWEDKEHIAFLDINPRQKGQTLVTTKKHFDSYSFNLPDTDFTKLFLAAKKVVKIIDKALNTERCVMITEGYGVNHVHVKLYPFPEGSYEGSTSTELGPRASDEDLKKIAEKIREKINN